MLKVYIHNKYIHKSLSHTTSRKQMGPHISRPINAYKTLGIKVGHTLIKGRAGHLTQLQRLRLLAISLYALFVSL